MRISIGQIIVLILLLFLLFGDFQDMKKKLSALLKQVNSFFYHKNRKKGT
uniref:Sec-independent protein translocase component tatA n=1 Tax=Nitzschia palea TaxID=303400 RepID=A0A2Z5ZC33_9STRA|nr:Sec-independent protein translocase component tatA [Nitzschia palea]